MQVTQKYQNLLTVIDDIHKIMYRESRISVPLYNALKGAFCIAINEREAEERRMEIEGALVIAVDCLNVGRRDQLPTPFYYHTDCGELIESEARQIAGLTFLGKVTENGSVEWNPHYRHLLPAGAELRR